MREWRRTVFHSRGFCFPTHLAFALILLGMSAQSPGDGLPVEYLLSHQWRNLHQYHSPLGNPAFMTEENYTAVRGVLSLAGENIAQLWEIGMVQPIGLYHSIGFSWIAENDNPLDNYILTEEGQSLDDLRFTESGTELRNHNSFFMASFATNPWRRLSVGANVNVLYQSRFDDPTQSVGLDLGASYRLLRHPILGNHTAGVSARNFLFYMVNPDIEKVDASQINGLIHSTFLENTVTFDCQVDVTDLLAKRDEFLSGASPTFEWDLYAQAGIWLLRAFTINLFAGYGQHDLEFWGLSLGLNLPSVNAGRDLSVAYQIRSEMSDDLMPSHSVYFRGDFGMHREELYARRMARSLGMSPNELYNRAMRLYYAGNYWDAYFIFAKIKANFPDFFKNDRVYYHMGSCLEELDMREEAITAYQETLDNFSTSDIVSAAELGMMRVDYRESNFTQATSRYQGLISFSRTTEASDSIKHHAAYLMGQIALKQGDYAQAVQVLSAIPDIHPEYIFAQHTAAIAYILLNNNMEKAVTYLENCVNAGGITLAQKEMVNRSCVLLGYIFYEEDRLARAIAALRMVAPESKYYAEAVLGQGWTAIKARQFGDCIATGASLAKTTTDTILACEGMLVQAYGLVMTKDFENAYLVLQTARNLANKYREPHADSLETRTSVYRNTRITYQQTAEEMVRLSPLGESDYRTRAVDSLHLLQIGQKTKIDDHLKYADLFQRRTFFARAASKVKDDLEFSLITVQKIRGDRATEKAFQREREQREGIDQEIKKVQEELQKMKEP